MDIGKYQDGLRKKLEKGFLHSTNTLLLDLDVKSLFFKELNILKQRYLSNEKNFVKNVISNESYQIEHNKILVAYLDLISGISEHDLHSSAKELTQEFREAIIKKIYPLEKVDKARSRELTLLYLAASFLLLLLSIYLLVKGWNAYLIEYEEIGSMVVADLTGLEWVIQLLLALFLLAIFIGVFILMPTALLYIVLRGMFQPFLAGGKQYLTPRSRTIKIAFAGEKRQLFRKLMDVFLKFNVEIMEMNFEEGVIKGVVTAKSDFKLSKQVFFETGELEIEGKYHLTGRLDFDEEKAEYESAIVIANHRSLVKSKYQIVTQSIDFFSIQLYQLNTIAETIRNTFISLFSDHHDDAMTKI